MKSNPIEIIDRVECSSSPAVPSCDHFDFAKYFDDVDSLAEIAAEVFAEALHDDTPYFDSIAAVGSQLSLQPQPSSS